MADHIITRAEAKRLGLKRYFTGNPCPHGHIAERWTSSGACYECVKAKAVGVVTRWREKQDPGEYRAYRAEQSRRWAERYPDKRQAQLQRLATLPRDKEHYAQLKKQWDEANADHVREYARKRQARLWIEDIQYRLRVLLRNRLNDTLNGRRRNGSAVRDLGCSIAEFKTYIEAQFEPGMTWDNWALDGWHLDHIKPLASFDLADRAQFLEACHFTNIRPLWAVNNLKRRYE